MAEPLELPLPRPERLRPLRRGEYDRLVELGVFGSERVELLYGMLVSMSPQGAPHAYVVRELTRRLTLMLGDRALVQAQSPLALSEESEPEPDVAVVPWGDYRQEHPHTALLVVEVAESSLRDDRLIKGRLYAEAAIPEYWIIDVRRVVLERHTRPSGSGYLERSEHGPGETLTLVALPEVSIETAAFLPG
jgi:Uma2 family endonuclease